MRIYAGYDQSGKGSTYAIVWSRRRIGGSVNLFRVSDVPLWSGYHVAERSGVGALSPVSIIMESFSAGRLASDTDITASLADDWARRLFITLPSTVIYDDRQPAGRSGFSCKEPKPWNKMTCRLECMFQANNDISKFISVITCVFLPWALFLQCYKASASDMLDRETIFKGLVPITGESEITNRSIDLAIEFDV